jgi:hypothetical protein
MIRTFSLAQDQATRDAISQQVRDQINAARKEAQDAARATRATTAPAAPLPGEGVSIQQLPFNPNDDIPPRAASLGTAFIVMVALVLIFWPITRAIARKLDRGNATPRVPAEVSGQLTQLTQAVDAIAVEVERISEGQRFTTRLLAEQRGEQSKTLLGPAAGGDRGAVQG